MPLSVLEDPTASPIPGPKPHSIPKLRHVYLRDHITPVTVLPVMSLKGVPEGLLMYLLEEFNAEIDAGDTYPMDQPFEPEEFRKYWFAGCVGLVISGHVETLDDVLASASGGEPGNGIPMLHREPDWRELCLGTFYIKPNYPGRCCHIANGGFMTCRAKRQLGVGKVMGEAYIEWAANLGYTYSVFNLVFETNTGSIKIWESLGFKRLGKIKGAGKLKGHANPVDAIIFGRDLSPDTDFVADQRFEKIRYYLEKGKYPPNSDRSEKSRLRSASTHYKLVDGKLMLNNKEVIADGHQQYEIAKREHEKAHGGINKTCGHISEKYHWVRIKETVQQVIKNCEECRDAKAPTVKAEPATSSRAPSNETIEHTFAGPKHEADIIMRENSPMPVREPETLHQMHTMHPTHPTLAPQPSTSLPTMQSQLLETQRLPHHPNLLPPLSAQQSLGQMSHLQYLPHQPLDLSMDPRMISQSHMPVQSYTYVSQPMHTHQQHPQHVQHTHGDPSGGMAQVAQNALQVEGIGGYPGDFQVDSEGFLQGPTPEMDMSTG